MPVFEDYIILPEHSVKQITESVDSVIFEISFLNPKKLFNNSDKNYSFFLRAELLIYKKNRYA